LVDIIINSIMNKVSLTGYRLQNRKDLIMTIKKERLFDILAHFAKAKPVFNIGFNISINEWLLI